MDSHEPNTGPALDTGGATGLRRSPTVLLLVDFINPLDFEGAERLAPAALAAARRAAEFKMRLARRGVQAIYANDNYGVWRSDFGQVQQRCLERGGSAAALARTLAPARTDIAILKPRHSAFFATPLQLLLEQLGTRRLIVVGLAADICVHFTAIDARVRGYELWVPADCVAAQSTSDRDAALRHMQRVLEADIRPASPVDHTARAPGAPLSGLRGEREPAHA